MARCTRGRSLRKGVYHVQTVNNDRERFKTRGNRQLRGVSTKRQPEASRSYAPHQDTHKEFS